MTTLVSVGIPVRNGGEALLRALESIVNQSHRTIEIIVSDNNSSDKTEEIVRKFSKDFEEIRYVRQPKFLSVSENFIFLLSEARGAYFMWAAHDDIRSLNFISLMLSELEKNPESILAFGDCYSTDSMKRPGVLTNADFDSVGLPPLERIRKATTSAQVHLYGLWRRDVLKKIRLHSCIWAWDQPLMIAAASIGHFKYVAGASFTYLTVPKSHESRALYQDGKEAFNKYKELINLIYATFKTTRDTSSLLYGLFAAYAMTLLHIKNIPLFFKTALSRSIMTNRRLNKK